MAAGRLRRLFEKLEPSERKAIVYTTFAAAIITFLPGEWEAGLVLLALTLVFYLTNRDLFRRAPDPKAKEVEPPPPAEERGGETEAGG
jgi:hypothetical protein